jgi:hypothetical protein
MMQHERIRRFDSPTLDPGCFGVSQRWSGSAFLMLTGLLAMGCALGPGQTQMYEGPPLPKEQVGIVRNGCGMDSGLSIRVMQIDGKDVPDPCADFALLPGEHQLEVGAKRLAPALQTGTMRSGGVLGAPPAPFPAEARQEQVLWTSPSTLRITCRVMAGQEVIIIGTGTGEEWGARCQSSR